MSLRIERVCAPDQLKSSTREQWNRLPVQSPTQLPDWLLTWWRVFGQENGSSENELCILTVFQQDTLVAVVPWYLNHSWQNGNCLRFLGDRCVGSVPASVIVGSVSQESLVRVLSHWLRCESGRRWQTINLQGVQKDEAVVRQIINNLHIDGCDIHTRNSVGNWAVDLPNSWEAFLSSLSPDHQEQFQRWQRTYFDTKRATVNATPTISFEYGWNQIARLNEPIYHEPQSEKTEHSVFGDRRYHEFHLEVLARLVPNAQAEISELVVDGQVVAANYVLRHADTIYCYQSGSVSRESRDDYGDLLILSLFRDAIRDGYRRIEFIRGDKSRCDWGALRNGLISYVVAASSLAGSAQVASYRAVDTLRALNKMIGASLSTDRSVL